MFQIPAALFKHIALACAGTNKGGCRLLDELFSYQFLYKQAFLAVRDMRQNGWVPLGNWHSHPESLSRPSEEDKRLAFDSSASYLILSLQNQKDPVLNSFHVEKGEAEKENLVLE